MSNYEKFQQAIEAFEPGANTNHIVQAQTELNEKTFTALAGRKLSLWTGNTTKTLVICLLVWFCFVVLVTVLTRAVVGGAFAGAWTGLMIIWMFRTTLITLDSNGMNLYFLEIRMTSAKFVVSDKLFLPYDQMTNMQIKTGRVFKNTHIIIEFLLDGKPRKVKLSAPQRVRKAPEHEENLHAMLSKLQSKFNAQ